MEVQEKRQGSHERYTRATMGRDGTERRKEKLKHYVMLVSHAHILYFAPQLEMAQGNRLLIDTTPPASLSYELAECVCLYPDQG